MVAALAAAFAVAVAPTGAVLAEEEPVLTIDGTICYESIRPDGEEQPHVTLRLSRPTKEEVIVVLHTEDGTAKSPDDYLGFERVEVVIRPGETRVEVPLVIVADKEREPDEYFLVIVDEARGAIIGNEKAEVVIKDGAPPKEEEPRK